MTAEVMQQTRLERLSAEDFETASIRSAAPSYVSEAPSYHSTLPPAETLPAYSHAAPAARADSSTPTPGPSSMLPPATSNTRRGPGLPPVPDTPLRTQMPQISEFRIASWSSLNSNPTARHYQAVANRRVTASRGGGSSGSNSSNNPHVQGQLRAVLGRLTEEEERERTRVRPLEDPYLVGEEAAANARRERLARESGDDILIREDRRWDLFLAQMNDWDQRQESWKTFTSRRRHRRWW
ncbi:hypothetical protein JX265_013282 [Neoarthrinium moseri]|uniref:Uncharacterized protein n=1 Tax=Neoarthrinium moseri TaxID=1658444 RepID=A0A9Q0AHW5_9PEZI|nr:hypothetical protein JX265_013282 [Neoarthrinium moseri]KAI1851849.1 hypothetical protein JX266_002702 [Neoarthrinium moseri]